MDAERKPLEINEVLSSAGLVAAMVAGAASRGVSIANSRRVLLVSFRSVYTERESEARTTCSSRSARKYTRADLLRVTRRANGRNQIVRNLICVLGSK